jgi:hypothetical protein
VHLHLVHIFSHSLTHTLALTCTHLFQIIRGKFHPIESMIRLILIHCFVRAFSYLDYDLVLLYSPISFYYLQPFTLKQMAGDRKGKAKVDEQPKKKKQSREERGWERAHSRSCCRPPSEAVQDLRVPGSYRGGVRARCTDSSRHSDLAPFCAYPGPSSDPTCLWWSSSPWVDAL